MLVFQRGHLIRYKGTGKIFVALDNSRKNLNNDLYIVTLATSLGEKITYEYPPESAEMVFEILAEGKDRVE